MIFISKKHSKIPTLKEFLVFFGFILIVFLVSFFQTSYKKSSAEGESWEILGSAGFSAGSVDYTSLSVDSNKIPYVAYNDSSTSSAATVMKYSSTTESWIVVGQPGFSAGAIDYTSLSIDSNDIPYVAYIEILQIVAKQQ